MSHSAPTENSIHVSKPSTNTGAFRMTQIWRAAHDVRGAHVAAPRLTIGRLQHAHPEADHAKKQSRRTAPSLVEVGVMQHIPSPSRGRDVPLGKKLAASTADWGDRGLRLG